MTGALFKSPLSRNPATGSCDFYRVRMELHTRLAHLDEGIMLLLPIGASNGIILSSIKLFTHCVAGYKKALRAFMPYASLG